jgi:hypothetical protein
MTVHPETVSSTAAFHLAFVETPVDRVINAAIHWRVMSLGFDEFPGWDMADALARAEESLESAVADLLAGGV